MRKWMLATSAAALAITAPALADKGGHGGGHGGNNAGQVQHGGGNDRARSSKQSQVPTASRGGGQGRRQMVAQNENRGHGQRVDRAAAKEHGQANRSFHAPDKGGHAVRAARLEEHGNRDRSNEARVLNADRVHDKGHVRFAEGDKVFKVRDVNRGVERVRDVDRDDLFMRRVGWVDGCPPGLAKKHNGCLPPGQAARFIGQPLAAASRIAALEALPSPLRPLYLDNQDYYYRYGGGYLYQVDRNDNLISSMIPLFGAALLGQPLQPNYVNSYYQPPYYNAFYPNSSYDCYRYGYGYVYNTNCSNGLVQDVIPTYDYGYGVGQILPSSYSYYNVPYAYRGYYPDSSDYYYRYAPGAIYQVDRNTSLISAVASLLTGGLSVGQPLPAGYSAYNVPYAYRSAYADTPDMWYRYNNGYIYSVDPTTQLVTAIVRALV